jgi:hypothetical protein
MRGASLVVGFVISAAAAAWRSSSLRLLAGSCRRNRCRQHRRNGVPPLSAFVPANEEGAVRGRVEDTALEGRGVTALLSLGSAPTINCVSTVDMVSAPETTTREEAATFENLLVGTKRGQIVRLRANQSNGRFLRSADELVIQDSDGSASSASTSKLPIYCFVIPRSSSLGSGENLLLAGGADRCVSVYRLPPEIVSQGRGKVARGEAKAKPPSPSLKKPPVGDGILRRIQKLGPHTGWVKDMVLIEDDAEDATEGNNSTVSSSCTLYSIGCNGIEIWKSYTRGSDAAVAQEEAREDARWRNAGKWTIESSALGCTLSSDLLCLAAQGGVGGRRRRAHPRLVDRSQPRQHPPCSNERRL